MKDYYYILGLKKEASIEDVKKAYRKLSLKFHPDKNDGDAFFADRFREINEAYETLSNRLKRIQYDTNFKDNKDTNDRFISDPIIEFFHTDKQSFEFNEEIKFSWKTINSDKVRINPFGLVKPTEQKTYKIKDFKNHYLKFELIAENSNTGRYTTQTITLNNRTYQELYLHFKRIIDSENKKNNQNGNNHKQESKTNKPIGEFKTDKGIIKVELNFKGAIPAMNNKVYQNGSMANNGKYKLGFMNYIVIKNGLIADLASF